MMLCKNCGKVISDRANYCKYCGKQIIVSNGSRNEKQEGIPGVTIKNNKKNWRSKAIVFCLIFTIIIFIFITVILLKGVRENSLSISEDSVINGLMSETTDGSEMENITEKSDVEYTMEAINESSEADNENTIFTQYLYMEGKLYTEISDNYEDVEVFSSEYMTVHELIDEIEIDGI
ncbi:MAG: zinc ribbon domain-containing protein, partial [Lachnospiraceae bacterium]|nr:zinc ribbon domain-containing protein [Lachnospiraceae bacterium]